MTHHDAGERELNFWALQIGGWSMVALLHMTVTYVVRGANASILSAVFLQVVAGFCLTSLMRLYYRVIRYQEFSLLFLVTLIFVCSLGMTLAWLIAYVLIDYMLLDSSVVRTVLQPQRAARILAFGFPDKLAWSTLYFGIAIWRDSRVERTRADRALLMAQQAQLESLRYQLNPGFLFGALKSVRSLIDDDTGKAKELVTSLSEFLRYSLISNKKTEVALREEVEVIRHYLNVEGMRLGHDLAVGMEIDADAEGFRLPSFVIHPIVERMVRQLSAEDSQPPRLTLHAQRVENGLRLVIRGRVGTHAGGAITEAVEIARARLKEVSSFVSSIQVVEGEESAEILLEIHQQTGKNDDAEASGTAR